MEALSPNACLIPYSIENDKVLKQTFFRGEQSRIIVKTKKAHKEPLKKLLMVAKGGFEPPTFGL